MYSVCKLVRMRLFGTMKYFSEYYKQGCLDRAYKELNIRDDESKSRYKDFIVYYIENKTNSQRNNCIYALRRCMLGLDTGGKYGNTKLDLCCSDSQSWFYSFYWPWMKNQMVLIIGTTLLRRLLMPGLRICGQINWTSTFGRRLKQWHLSSCRRFLSKSLLTKETRKKNNQELINTGDTSVLQALRDFKYACET